MGKFTVSGNVRDAAGAPIPGVYVMIKSTNAVVETNLNGDFTIEVRKGNTLKFTYVGYSSQEYTVNNGDKINIVLQEDKLLLTELIFTGYSGRGEMLQARYHCKTC